MWALREALRPARARGTKGAPKARGVAVGSPAGKGGIGEVGVEEAADRGAGGVDGGGVDSGLLSLPLLLICCCCCCSSLASAFSVSLGMRAHETKKLTPNLDFICTVGLVSSPENNKMVHFFHFFHSPFYFLTSTFTGM